MIKFRDAKPADAKEIFRIQADGWNYAYKNILSPKFLAYKTSDESIQEKINKFREVLNNYHEKNNLFLVALEENKIVGYFGGGSIESEQCRADKELHRLYIDTNYIGTGLGKKLIQEFAKRMKLQGAKTFGLMCLSNNKSMGFYKQMGGIVTVEKPTSEKLENTMGSFLEFNIDEVLSK
jgi:GNAT superfamily N-acetyltransferase